MTKTAATKTLGRLGIRTTADLDRWIQANQRIDQQGRPYLMSRYRALCELAGENAATWILNDLAVAQCA